MDILSGIDKHHTRSIASCSIACYPKEARAHKMREYSEIWNQDSDDLLSCSAGRHIGCTAFWSAFSNIIPYFKQAQGYDKVNS